MAHRGRAFLSKLAHYFRSLLTETHTAIERGYQDILEELTVVPALPDSFRLLFAGE
jgi:hypothetical protein